MKKQIFIFMALLVINQAFAIESNISSLDIQGPSKELKLDKSTTESKVVPVHSEEGKKNTFSAKEELRKTAETLMYVALVPVVAVMVDQPVETFRSLAGLICS